MPRQGKDTEQQASQLFNRLMAEGSDFKPPPDKIRMADLLRAYVFYLVSFDAICRTMRPHQITPSIVDSWLKTEKGWKADHGTRYSD